MRGEERRGETYASASAKNKTTPFPLFHGSQF
jgi:hypothetical protein